MTELDLLFDRVNKMTYPGIMKKISDGFERIAFFPGERGLLIKAIPSPIKI